jgi:hypothetical protein
MEGGKGVLDSDVIDQVDSPDKRCARASTVPTGSEVSASDRHAPKKLRTGPSD